MHQEQNAKYYTLWALSKSMALISCAKLISYINNNVSQHAIKCSAIVNYFLGFFYKFGTTI